MKNWIQKIIVCAGAAAIVSALSGCAGYDQWAENTNRSMNSGWTELLHGKQTVDASALPKGMIVNIAYGKGEGSGIPGRSASNFYDKLYGDLVYDKTCSRMLKFNVDLFNDAGGLIQKGVIFIGPYDAGIKQLIDQAIIADPLMQKSKQVTRLVLSAARCM